MNKLQAFAQNYRRHTIDFWHKGPKQMPDGEIAAHIYRVTGKLYKSSYIRQMRQGHHPISELVELRLDLTAKDLDSKNK